MLPSAWLPGAWYRDRFQGGSGADGRGCGTWRPWPARRAGLGLGLRPHAAASPAPGWGGPQAPGTERAGPLPGSRALGGTPGAQADSPRGRAGLFSPRCQGEAREIVPRAGWDPFLTLPREGI